MDYKNNFLFSEAYIRNAFKKVEKSAKEYDDTFDNISSWYQEYKNDWTVFEDIVLDTLGFEKEQDGEYRWIRAMGAEAVALVYLLDKDCTVGSTVKGRYYAVDAVKKAVERNVSWVMITNGLEWRLLNTAGVSPYEHYFSVNIENELEAGKADVCGHIFVYMFGTDSFKTNGEGVLAIDWFKDKSDESEENVEDVLRSKAESILTGLCYGLKDNMNKQTFTEEDKKQIYEDAIILLYRLLFLGYAEARELLPVKADDPDYQDSFSMLCQTAKDYYLESRLTEIGDDFDLWDRLDSQLRIYVDKNYNGGLFSNEDKPILKEFRIANKHLAPCLMELAYISGRGKDYSQKIEYKDLSVRNLGAIYEGLLEYQLFIADELMVQRKSKEKVAYIKASETTLKNSDKNNLVQPGEIYLSQDAMERKETGAYYTPEDVVDYIVENTVGKRLEELKEELDKELSEIREELSYEPVEQRIRQLQHEIDEKTIEFIKEKILSLSIVDSAMGSGHFLVNAAYQVSNYIVDILEGNKWENEEINADVTYWRRKVVENCIYGIDINNLSVLLARLSLWLISVTNDKALSFIDHHLKCGNSIVGTTTDKVQYINKSIPLFNMTKEQYMLPILKKYERIKEIGSDTKADVALQHEAYEEILSDLAVIKRKMDYYLASMYAGGISDDAEFQKVMYADDINFFEAPEFNSLMKYADSNKFFHWELEFPEVSINGGFDIYIGNPPYVEADSTAYIGIIHTAECHNLYTYILENTLNNCSQDAEFGVILPSACTSTPRMAPFQNYLINVTKNVRFAIFDDRPGKLFLRLQHMRAAIITGEKGRRETKNIETTKYVRWFSDERKHLFDNIQYAETKHYDLVEGNIPKVGNQLENRIIEKIFSCKKTVEDYIDETHADNGIYYGYGVQYWIKAMYKSADEIDKGARKSTGEKEMHFDYSVDSKIFSLILNSNLFYWYFVLFSDCRNLTRTVISRFPIDISAITSDNKSMLVSLSEELLDDYIKNSNLKTANYVGKGEIVYREYSVRKSKPIIDKADRVLGDIYGLTDEEISFIQNYDVRFRVGED